MLFANVIDYLFQSVILLQWHYVCLQLHSGSTNLNVNGGECIDYCYIYRKTKAKLEC